jgi:hypothetical protein
VSQQSLTGDEVTGTVTGKVTAVTGKPKTVVTGKSTMGVTGEPKLPETTEAIVPTQADQFREIDRRLGIGTGAKDKDAVKLDAITYYVQTTATSPATATSASSWGRAT